MVPGIRWHLIGIYFLHMTGLNAMKNIPSLQDSGASRGYVQTFFDLNRAGMCPEEFVQCPRCRKPIHEKSLIELTTQLTESFNRLVAFTDKKRVERGERSYTEDHNKEAYESFIYQWTKKICRCPEEWRTINWP